MYKLAIVDDEMGGETGRKSYYEDTFGKDFEIVKLVSAPEEMLRVQNLEVDAYLIDLVYDGEQYNGITFSQIIRNINKVKNVPIFLISSKWEIFKQAAIANELCGLKNIVRCFGWDEIDGENNHLLINSINLMIGEFFSYTNTIKSSDEKITILHMSDLQFGDKGLDATAIFTDGYINNYLEDKNKIPDLIVISGDIAAKGRQEEYDQAYKWLEEFCLKLWGEGCNWKEKIIVVPGNHDVDYKLCMLDYYYLDMKETPQLISGKDNVSNEYQKIAFLNYAAFVEKINGDGYFINNYWKLFRVNEKFLNWGIRIYEMNTAQAVNPFQQQKIDISNDNYEFLTKNTLKNGYKNVFNIIVSHYGPEDIGFRSCREEAIQKWEVMRGFIEAEKIGMFLAGHVHRSEIRQLGGSGHLAEHSKQMIVSTASTCLLNSASRPNDESRGFNILELGRVGGVVNKITGYIYEMKGANIFEADKFECQITI